MFKKITLKELTDIVNDMSAGEKWANVRTYGLYDYEKERLLRENEYDDTGDGTSVYGVEVEIFKEDKEPVECFEEFTLTFFDGDPQVEWLRLCRDNFGNLICGDDIECDFPDNRVVSYDENISYKERDKIFDKMFAEKVASLDLLPEKTIKQIVDTQLEPVKPKERN